MTNGYLVITIDYSRILAHHIAWAITHGYWPDIEIDHENRTQSDNRLINLRLAGQSNNGANQASRSTNTSGYKGVTFDRARGLWKAQIKKNYKNIFLGRFASLIDAAHAYDAAARRMFGEFAVTNFQP